MHKKIAVALAAIALLVLPARAEGPDAADWRAVLEDAKGETVYFHAWGGEPRINAYIEWASDMIAAKYGVRLEHVKLDDTAHAVSRIVAEKAAGKDHGGRVDLVWINGENFAALKNADLLYSPGWAEKLPNWKYVDVEGKPAVVTDFTVPTEGLESPWGMAKLVFVHDSARLAHPPKTLDGLYDYLLEHPGRFAYPQPPNFHGSTFLKQVLASVIVDPAKLQRPVDEATFGQDVAPLFAYLDKLHPKLWREGRAFPQSAADLRRLLADGEIDISFTFNPSGTSAAIEAGELPDTVRTFVLDGGTIGNAHFLAIPYNANAKAGALVAANFLLSPEAQAKKQDPHNWGDPTVLDVNKLSDDERAIFDEIDLGVATLPPEDLGPVIPEPHASWMTRIEEEWIARYAAQ
ncbi:ABC transporter substrate-binding protein [Stappia sp. GBMRC 2046]|uniref:ABC transporter substrate-binding protein n=1 Tax=Stappia sediminis TaxID=2692190 RepID=A0A7X3LWP9_9HYPH|nr:ABC transporter substrate-binding protein [Stappia sediminis]MXN66457.1 ABC transporter substrate-binding protein [Stappia sediminis]